MWDNLSAVEVLKMNQFHVTDVHPNSAQPMDQGVYEDSQASSE